MTQAAAAKREGFSRAQWTAIGLVVAGLAATAFFGWGLLSVYTAPDGSVWYDVGFRSGPITQRTMVLGTVAGVVATVSGTYFASRPK